MHDHDKLSALNDQRVLVTGASGFIGYHLIAALLELKAEVSVLDRFAPDPKLNVDVHLGDMRDKAFVAGCVEKIDPDIVFHLAAYKERSASFASFYEAIDVNVIGSLNLFEAVAGLSNLRSIVVMGTAEEYGYAEPPFVEGDRELPVSAYSFSKLCVTHLCEVVKNIYNMPCVVVRPTIAYGPGQGTDMFLPALIRSVINSVPFAMTPAKQTRDFIYVTDLVEALLLAALNGNAVGQTINIGSGQPISIANVALQVERMLGKSDLIQIGAKDYRCGEIMSYCVDCSKAGKLLDWTAKVNFDEGLARTIDYYETTHSFSF